MDCAQLGGKKYRSQTADGDCSLAAADGDSILGMILFSRSLRTGTLSPVKLADQLGAQLHIRVHHTLGWKRRDLRLQQATNTALTSFSR